jgi:hypothetical protein
MGPPLAVARRVWIATFIRVSVMQAMNSNPVDWASLEGKRATGGDQVFQPLRSRVSAVSQQAVIAHGYSNILRQNPYNEKDNKCRPTKIKQCSNCAKMKTYDCDCENPIDSTAQRLGVKIRLLVN